MTTVCYKKWKWEKGKDTKGHTNAYVTGGPLSRLVAE